MDLYTSSLLLGAAGLGVMALGGLGGRHHGGGHGSHAGGHGHGGGHGWFHLGGHGSHGTGDGHGGHGVAVRGGHHAPGGGSGFSFVNLLSPRLLFSLALGFGATGLLARHLLGGVLLLLVAVIGGVAFELLAAGPVSNFFFRFGSRPAATLETSLEDEVRAVTGFDGNGQGLVALELDGQRVQLLATLSAEDRAAGVRVRSGDRLRVKDVDAARNRCTVSLS